MAAYALAGHGGRLLRSGTGHILNVTGVGRPTLGRPTLDLANQNYTLYIILLIDA